MRVVATAALVMSLAVAARAPSSGSTDNRAAVVVELPSGETRSACVLFAEPSITGLDLLVAAQMDPKTYGMGPGAAVCKLCGEGCPQTRSGCLSCDGGKYWQYYRADGDGGYRYSNVGAGSSEVTDGDVDGWRFGSDSKQPVLVALETVCSDPARTFRYEPAASERPPPSTTSTTGAATSTTVITSTTGAPVVGAPAPPTTARRPSATTSPVALPSTTLAAPRDASTTSTALAAAPEAPGPTPRSIAKTSPPSKGSSAPAVVVFGLFLAGIVAWTIRVRRVRHRPS